MGGYTHVLLNLRSGPMPTMQRTSWRWKIMRDFYRQEFTTRVSNPNKINNWTTATNNFPSVLLFTPSLTTIFTINSKLSWSHWILRSTADQLLSVDNIMHPKYFNDGTSVSGFPYSNKKLRITYSVYAITNLRRILSVMHWHIAYVRCALLSASCGTNMLHWGHRGWGWLPYSRITMLSRGCW